MTVRAKMSFRFIWRLGLIGFICLGGVLYCLYDGFVGYPEQRDRRAVYDKMQDDFKEQGRKPYEFQDAWNKLAAERGWSENIPKDKDDIDIAVQFWMAAVLAVPGLFYLYFFATSFGRWIEMTETGLRTSTGHEFTFDQIVTLNKTKWKRKGIARIAYDDNGRRRRVALDDWKYDVEATKAILCGIESHIELSQIVGGPPEPPPGEDVPDESQPEPPEGESAAAEQSE